MWSKINTVIGFGILSLASVIIFQNCSAYENVREIASATKGEDIAVQDALAASTYNTYGAVNAGVTPPAGGIDGNGYAYNMSLLGASVSYAGTTFTIGASGTKNSVKNTKVTVAAGKYASMHILATAYNGYQIGQIFTVNYSDGTVSTMPRQSISDWGAPQNFTGETIVKTMAGRIAPAGKSTAGSFNIYGYSFNLDSSKTVESITLPPNGDIVVFGINFLSPASVVPSAATRGGFTSKVFDETFTGTSNIDLANEQKNNKNWYLTNPAWTAVTIDPARFTYDSKNKALKIDGTGYGTSLFGCMLPKGASSAVGHYFSGGAYYEARLAFKEPIDKSDLPANTAHTNGSGNPWPAFWMVPSLKTGTNYQWPGAPAGYVNSVEVDIMEVESEKASGHDYPISGFTLHDWYNTQANGASYLQIKGAAGSTRAGLNTAYNVKTSQTSALKIASLDTDATFTFHNYGALIVPPSGKTAGYIQYYFDDVPQNKVENGLPQSAQPMLGLAPNYESLPTTAATTHNFTPLPGDSWAYLAAASQPYCMILQSGGDAWVEVQYVRVWQK